MEDLRDLASAIYDSGDKIHAAKLRKQIKRWEKDSTWPLKITAPSLQFSWGYVDAKFLDETFKMDETGHWELDPDILLIKGKVEEFFIVNSALETSLLRFMRGVENRVNLPDGSVYRYPLGINGSMGLSTSSDPEVEYSGFVFPKLITVDRSIYLTSRQKLIEEANTILPDMGRPLIPDAPH